MGSPVRAGGNSDAVALLFIAVGASVLGVAAVRFSPLLAIAAVGGGGAATLILARPFLGLVLFAFVASFLPFTQIAERIPLTLCESVLLLTWLSVLPRIAVGSLRLHLGATERAVLVLVGYSIIPLLLGIALIPYGKLGAVRWSRWIVNISPLFLVGCLVQGPRDLTVVIRACIAGAMATLLLSIGSFIRHWDARDILPILATLHYPQEYRSAMSETFGIVHRISSPWIHANMLGGFLTLILPPSMIYFLKAREPWRMIMLVFLSLALVALLLSISRAAILGLGFVALYFIRWRVPLAVPATVLGLVCVVLIVIFYPPVQERFTALLSKERTPSGFVMSSGQTRLEEYKAFPRAVAQFPFGVGFATDPTAIVEHYPGLRQISNLWLNYWYKLGLPGMLLFLWVSLRWWREAKPPQRFAGNSNPALRLYQVGLVGGLIGTFVIGFLDHYFSFQWVLVAMFWMFIGLSLIPPRDIAENCEFLQGNRRNKKYRTYAKI